MSKLIRAGCMPIEPFECAARTLESRRVYQRIGCITDGNCERICTQSRAAAAGNIDGVVLRKCRNNR